MGVVRPRRHLQRFPTATAFSFLVLVTSASAAATVFPAPRPATIEGVGAHHQKRSGVTADTSRLLMVAQWRGGGAVGPGSSPPTCKSKCGNCSPCKAVHVAIHPGVSVPLEYYPEAWRCKCGNKLFMP